MGGARRLTIGVRDATTEVEESLFEVLGGLTCSFTRDAAGGVSIFLEPGDVDEARGALTRAGIAAWGPSEEPDVDWVAASAALREPVAIGPFLLDPHDGPLASRPGRRVRLHLPAARAFGTGSHESTRLALRLLLQLDLSGKRVLDVGCGAGTLAFVAALGRREPSKGSRTLRSAANAVRRASSFTVAFDLDMDAAVATREGAGDNDVRGVATFAGPIDALAARPLFDVVVANMIAEEVGPLLPMIRERLKPRGRLVTSGQLLSREAEWLSRLRSHGFSPVALAAEGEWLGATSVKR
ncbi:MAG TPA: 50S ribosomal protein L11 methyltransferase [Thermoanaerobaculia bacterium]|nr:50S ribosomal protein L11 methyltransferase [Thermoanaerobaculia bacterium]